MSSIEEQVKSIVANSLASRKRRLRTTPLLLTTWAPIRWTPSSWLWRSRRNSKPRFPTKKPRKSRRCSRRSTSSTPTQRILKYRTGASDARRFPFTNGNSAAEIRNDLEQASCRCHRHGDRVPGRQQSRRAWRIFERAILALSRSKISITAAFSTVLRASCEISTLTTIWPKDARKMDPFMHYGIGASVDALEDSG